MKFKVVALFLLLIFSSSYAQINRNGFNSPPIKYRPVPLWFWNNTEIKESELVNQFRNMIQKDGYGGCAILPFGKNFQPEYLSDAYFRMYGSIIDEARKMGAQMSIYDEYGFPSGSMGGINGNDTPRFMNKYPDATIKRLDKFEFKVNPNTVFKQKLPEGKLMSVVAMDTLKSEIISLTSYIKNNEIQWNAPAGAWKVLSFVCVKDGDPNVDYLDPDAVKLFIKETHQAYYDRFKSDFGNVITSTFFDEPTLYRAEGRMWTDKFNEKFKAQYGFSPELLYPALWYDIGENTPSARNYMFGFRSRLYAEGFMKTIQEWAAKHDIISTGHQDQEEILNPVSESGDLMLCGKYMDAPGIDKIGGDRPAELFYKIISSSAYNWDKHLVMSETYGAMGNLPIDEMYHIAMEQYTKGINMLIPHAVWYNDKDVYFLPELSYRNPLYNKELPGFNKFLSRLNLMLQNDGRHIADIAMLYPIESLQGEHYLDGKLGYYKGGVEIPNTDYTHIASLLNDSIGKDFTYLHPEVLNEKCEIKDQELILKNTVNKERFKILIIPGMKTISLFNLKKIESFHNAGGHIIFTTQIPSQSVEFGKSQEVKNIIQKLLASNNQKKVFFIEKPDKESIDKILKNIGNIVFDVDFPEGNSLNYIHKVYNGQSIYYFANLNNKSTRSKVIIKGKIKPIILNPHTGEQSNIHYAYETRQGIDVTSVNLDIPYNTSLFLIDSNPVYVKEPYPSLSGSFSGEKVSHSPDPLVSYRWNNPKATDDLEIFTIYPQSVSSDKAVHSIVEKDLSHIRITGDCSLLFDFGQVNAGWLEFDSDNLEGNVEMSISEFNEPAVFNAGSEHPEKTLKPARYGNTYRLELNKDLYEGVRFGWITINKLRKPADIKNVRLICQTKPINYNGSFACSDTMLTRIWYTGAYTVRTNLLKDYLGAILMERSDRHSWTGDAHTSQAASMVAFGNYDFVKTNIRYTSTQSNGILSYSLYWVLSLIDYYNYTGDKELVEEMLSNACGKLDLAFEHFGKNPDLRFYGWDERLGAGFENASCPESQNAYKMLSIQTWHKFGNMLSQTGHTELAKKYKEYALKKIEELRSDKNGMIDFGIHAAADAINTNLLTSEEKEKLWNIAFSDRNQRLSYSPFNQFFIINSLAEMKRYPEALTTIYDCWGGQVNYGGTTFFEVFRPSWNVISKPNDAPVNNQCGYTSFTHPWSAGITKWLTEEIAGIKPTSPGFTSCTVKPRLSSDITWVKGSVLTPHGTLSSSFDITNGKGDVNIPEGVTATIGIPKAGQRIKKITINGQKTNKSAEDNDFIYFILKTGNYSIDISYSGKLSTTNTEPFNYLINTSVKEDRKTQGNWKNHYGSQGYILCNYDSINGNRKNLPSFIEDITFMKNGNEHWATSTQDKRALISDISNERNLGAFITRDPIPCDQTMTIDITCKKEQSYNVSLYFVDWDKQNKRSAIEIFDLDNKEIQMPVYMVRDYEDGVYVTYTFDKSVRIRIDQVRGKNASFSGLFFD